MSAVGKALGWLRSSRWGSMLLWLIDILLLLELVLPFPFIARIFLWLASVVLNHAFTPIVIQKVFDSDLSLHGQLMTRHFRTLQLDPDVLAEHTQLSSASCIPMSVEFVLKLLREIQPKDFPLQRAWNNRTNGSFSDFDAVTLNGIRFKHQFPLSSNPRGSSFPITDLFNTIDGELRAGRYVIVSLATPPYFHNWVIYNRLPNGEYRAATKGHACAEIQNVRAQVQTMQGTDILTYSRE